MEAQQKGRVIVDLDGVERIDDETIANVRSDLFKWQLSQFPDRYGADMAEDLRLGIFEELGELAHAILKRRQGIRGMDVDRAFEFARDDAIGDVLVYASQLFRAHTVAGGDAARLFGDSGTTSRRLALFYCDHHGIKDQEPWGFNYMVAAVAVAASVSIAHAKLCFVETARKVMKRTDRTETREEV